MAVSFSADEELGELRFVGWNFDAFLVEPQMAKTAPGVHATVCIIKADGIVGTSL